MPAEVTYTNIRLWDGQADGYSDHRSVSVANGMITAVGESRGQSRDFAGLTCLPGLIDAHVHMTLDPNIPSVDEQLKQSRATIEAKMLKRTKAMVHAGITTARDLGGGDWLELNLRDRIEAHDLVGPRLLCAGRPITSVQGHCHFWHGECPDFDSAKQLIDMNIEKGVDLVKVMATGGMYTKGSKPSAAQFTQRQLDEFVTYANRQELGVAAHCHGSEGINFAAYAGVDTIEHCSWLNDSGRRGPIDIAATQYMAKNAIYVSPTINSGWARFKGKDNQHLKHVREIFVQMKNEGVELIASTDAGIPNVQHDDLPKALSVFAEYADLTPLNTLKSATSVAAKALKIAQLTGTVRPGLRADLIFVEGDPLTDLAAVQNVKVTLTNGYETITGE